MKPSTKRILANIGRASLWLCATMVCALAAIILLLIVQILMGNPQFVHRAAGYCVPVTIVLTASVGVYLFATLFVRHYNSDQSL